jgi:hypothetical protein
MTLRTSRLLVTVLALGLLAGAGASAQEAPPPQPTPTPTPTPAVSQTANYFNPAISVIGNFLAVGGQNRFDDQPSISLRESELAFQAVVDPYGRADFFFSGGEDAIEVEEGYLTLTALPWDLLVKLGRVRVSFGKVNTMHLHMLPWPDEPLPIPDILGSEEGWIGSGASISRLIPLPGDVFSELTLQVFRGDSPLLFVAPTRGGLAYNGHYRVFADLSDSTNIDVGASYAFGPNGTTATAMTHLSGIDAVFRWKPLRTALYRQLILRGELYHSNREQPGGAQSATGWYVSGEYQFARRWWVGIRGESSQVAVDAAIKNTGEAATLTFNPSEFSQFRGELRRRRYAESYTASEFLFQVQFAIGAHGAHPF